MLVTELPMFEVFGSTKLQNTSIKPLPVHAKDELGPVRVPWNTGVASADTETNKAANAAEIFLNMVTLLGFLINVTNVAEVFHTKRMDID